jgi:Trm5-related predicted tRNA methylase
MSIEQLEVNVLSNPADRDKLLGVLKELSASMARVEGERSFMKEAIADITEQLQLPKKLVAKMAKVYHKQNYDEEVATHEQFETLYQTVVK